MRFSFVPVAVTLILGVALTTAPTAQAASDAGAHAQWKTARAYIARGDFARAMRACRKLAKAPGAVPASHVCAAEAHLLWRRGTEALAELSKVGDGADVDVRYAAEIARGRAEELASRSAEAERAYRAAVAIAPRRGRAHLLLGVLLRRTGRDGLSELRLAVKADPRDPSALLELGRALPTGSSEAIARLEQAVAERPTLAEGFELLARAFLQRGKLPEAKLNAGKLLALTPKDPASHVLAGRVALAEGDADAALREGKVASKLMPNVATAKLLVADAWAKKGEIDLAVESYQGAFGLNHQDPAPLVRGAEACLAAGRVTSAKAFGVRATKEFPEHGPAWEALGDALAKDGDAAGARRAYQRAKKAKGADPAAIDRKLSRLK